jgi:hypothetical protein
MELLLWGIKYDRSLVTIYDIKGQRIYTGTVPQLRIGLKTES